MMNDSERRMYKKMNKYDVNGGYEEPIVECFGCNRELVDFGYDLSEYGGEGLYCAECAIEFLRNVYMNAPFEEDGFDNFDEWLGWAGEDALLYLGIDSVDVENYLLDEYIAEDGPIYGSLYY